MTIPDHLWIERQGKRYVLYGGLLAESHAIFTKLWDMKTEELDDSTEDFPKVKATFRGVDKDGRFVTTTGHGDATVENVNRNIAPHLLRMAETRAKARALRDAVNVGEAAFEEIVDGDPAGTRPQPQRQQQRQSQRPQQSGGDQAHGGKDPNAPATDKQLNYLKGMIEEAGASVEEWEQSTGLTFDNLTRKQASEAISDLR